MPEVLISKELVTLSIPDNLIPVEQYDEIVKDIRLQYEMELAEAACDRQEAEVEYLQSDEYLERCIEIAEAQAEQEQAENDAQIARNIEISDAIYDEQQAQIEAWDVYIDSLSQGEYIDVTPVSKLPVEKKTDSFSITEKEIFIEEVEEITLGPVKTLVFGRAIGTKGVVVSESQWQSFLADSITIRFPEGYTKINSEGLWNGGEEESNAILFACPDTPENKEKLTQIVIEYCNRFNQDAVLKINSDGIGSLLQIKKGEANA